LQIWAVAVWSAKASVFNSDLTSNAFFQGFDAKLPCDMMFKKDDRGGLRSLVLLDGSSKSWWVPKMSTHFWVSLQFWVNPLWLLTFIDHLNIDHTSVL
jgi:hypothetical protein